MIWLLHVIVAAVGLWVGWVTLYLLCVTWAARRRSEPIPELPVQLRLAVLIPAHNEATCIESTLDSLASSDYPPDHYQVYVLADNCSDNTAELARQLGAQVFERFDANSLGKGPALDWCLRTHTLLTSHYDAVVMVDADTHVAPDFLRAVSTALICEETEAVQGVYAVENPASHWRGGLTYAGFALINYVRPWGAWQLGGSAGLRGTGMAFSSRLLRERGWPADSVVEDCELGLMLALDGVRVGFAPTARVTSPMPVTREDAESQRRRWELGRMGLLRRYSLPLVLAKNRAAFLALCDLMVPPLSLWGFSLISAALLSYWINPLWAVFFLACLGATFVHVVAGLIITRAPRSVWCALLASPLFLLWKLGLYCRMLVHPHQTKWVKTTRHQ